MGVWKKEKKWLANFWRHGKLYKKQGFNTKAEALDWVVDKRREIEEQERLEQSTLTFFNLSAQYLQDCKARFQRNTWRYKASVYRRFMEFIGGDIEIEEITKDQVRAFLLNRQQTAGNKAANRDQKELTALFNWGIRMDMLFRNLCNGIEKYPEDSVVRYIPPTEDIQKVLLAAEPNEMELLLAVYHTGARIGEVLRMVWETDVNFEQRYVRLMTRKRRGGALQEDRIPMNDTLYRLLWERWKRRDKSSPFLFPEFTKPGPGRKESTYHLMPKICKRAGVKPFGFHSIRHYVASLIQDSGKATLKQIQGFLRHKRQTTMEYYLHLIDRSLEDAVNILEDERQDELFERIGNGEE